MTQAPGNAIGSLGVLQRKERCFNDKIPAISKGKKQGRIFSILQSCRKSMQKRERSGGSGKLPDCRACNLWSAEAVIRGQAGESNE